MRSNILSTSTFLAVFFTAFVVDISSALAATVTFGTPSGASNYVAGENAGDKPIIYGAVGGNPCATNPGSTAFCNSCAAGTTACSERRIHANLMLQINFTVTAETPGFIYVGIVDGGTYSVLTSQVVKSDASTVGKDYVGYVQIPWGEICNAYVAGDTTCNGGNITTSKDMFVAISPDNVVSAEEATLVNVRVFAPDPATSDDISCADSPAKDGICTFVVSPGDEKVYIDAQSSGSYPAVNSVPVRFVRLFYADTGNVTDINYAYPYADISVDDAGDLNNTFAEGFQNDVTYGFKVAIVDDAYNVALMTSTAQVNTTCGGNGAIPADDATCDFITTPANVLGLLSEDVNCFVTTAAYGSNMAAKVQTFRDFRNKFLLSNSWGTKFVQAYYHFGPFAARFINNYPSLKPVARIALWPLWAFAQLSLSQGLAIGFAFLLSIVSAFVLAARGILVWRAQQKIS